MIYLVALDPLIEQATKQEIVDVAVIATHLINKAGVPRSIARTGAVTLIQRFGSALNLNLHFHMLFLDGVYVEHAGRVRFRWVSAPTSAELSELAQRIAQRVGRYLERQGLLQRDAQHSYLAGERIDESPMDPLWGHSITWRIAIGPQAGRKVMTLQTLPAAEADQAGAAGNVGGFSLHAGVAVRANQRNKRERLCRYISRPALSEQRLSLTAAGKVRYQLKTPYNNGTTHVVFEPLDFLAKLAALVPRPRVNLTRYHGVFAPNSAHRALVTRAGRGKNAAAPANADERTPSERHAAMRWAQRLKRVFGIDVQTCAGCGGTMRIIACIEDPVVIKAILAHRANKARPVHAVLLPPGRAPPGPVVS